MPTASHELREHLLRTNTEFRELWEQHHELDVQIAEMVDKPHLSEDEQLEEIRLKKQKLQLKDRMEDLLRRHADVAIPPSTSASSMSVSSPSQR
ncbi:MAG: DUF465 domain-containing protein [Luteitalea sp.]|nr:DUF465 domain-containing protein [Luteitalea sp.]